jgi:nickel-dependent lactate racemase
MRVGINYGRDHLDLEVREGSLVGVRRQPPAPPLADPAGAVRAALEAPLGFPPLRRALTPEDHVAIVVDEHLPHLATLLTPLLVHLTDASIAPEAITLVCPPSSSRQDWLDDLPEEFGEVRVEVHAPGNRRRLSYLATTRQGRRLYLNRTVVDADQLVVLTGRGYDPLHGYGGAEAALYPALSDEETRKGFRTKLSLEVRGETAWPARAEAVEVAWLLGAPFLIQVIEGSGDDLAYVIAGLIDSSVKGQQLLDARWRLTVAEPAHLVVASLSGDPARHDFSDLARALVCASRVVRPSGRIVLLSQANPRLGPAVELLQQAGDPRQALELLRRQQPSDPAAAFQWASAAEGVQVYLLSGLPAATIEELFAVPLEHAGQVQRLLDGAETCLLLEDAHKALAVTG